MVGKASLHRGGNALAFNVALSVTPQVPMAVTVTAWAVTGLFAVLWLIVYLAERSARPGPILNLEAPSTPNASAPNSTMAIVIRTVELMRSLQAGKSKRRRK